MAKISYDTPAQQWAWQHFGNTGLNDGRLKRRAIQLAAGMAENPGASLSAQHPQGKEIKGAYRFFSNPRVGPDELQTHHQAMVKQEMGSAGTYLLIEDTSEFSWSGKQPIEGLGPVGSGKQGAQGFHLHSVLVTKWPEESAPDSLPKRPPLEMLGVAHQEYYIRKPIPKGEPKSRSFHSTSRARESQLWTRSGFHLGTPPKGARWVRICDRGADIYEVLRSYQHFGHDYVVRASRDRSLLDPHSGEKLSTRLFDTARKAPSLGTFSLPLRARNQIAARKAQLEVSCLPVVLRAPQRKGHPIGTLPAIASTVIWVRESDPPQDVKQPLEWFLLCSAKVETFSQALVVVQQYACRWLIEEYHKALKTGMGAEKLQMEHADHLFAAIAIMAIVALRLLDLREALRFHAEQPAHKAGCTDLELTLLRAETGSPCRTAGEVALAIGRLGGHLGRKRDGMPGWITLYRGMNKLVLMVRGALLFSSLLPEQQTPHPPSGAG